MALIDDISDVGGQLAAAINAKDAAAAAACYTPDAFLLAPGASTQVGTSAIEATWQAAIDGGLGDLVLETTEVEDFGDTATEVGVFTFHAGTGKYVVIWKKTDGAWRLHRDCFNLDA